MIITSIYVRFFENKESRPLKKETIITDTVRKMNGIKEIDKFKLYSDRHTVKEVKRKPKKKEIKEIRNRENEIIELKEDQTENCRSQVPNPILYLYNIDRKSSKSFFQSVLNKKKKNDENTSTSKQFLFKYLKLFL
jgi:hypothetical protein